MISASTAVRSEPLVGEENGDGLATAVLMWLLDSVSGARTRECRFSIVEGQDQDRIGLILPKVIP